MSTKDEISLYLEGEAKLRNKDYITIPRHEYKSLLSMADKLEAYKIKEKILAQKELALIERERRFLRESKNWKYSVHKRINSLANEILKWKQVEMED